jgi:hypothetical protein
MSSYPSRGLAGVLVLGRAGEEAAMVARQDPPAPDISRRSGANVNASATAAAKEVHARGGSPRAQIDAARAASGQRLNYMPHQGSRESARRLARLRAAESKDQEIA